MYTIYSTCKNGHYPRLTKYILTKGVSNEKKGVNSFPQINIQNKASK